MVASFIEMGKRRDVSQICLYMWQRLINEKLDTTNRSTQKIAVVKCRKEFATPPNDYQSLLHELIIINFNSSTPLFFQATSEL